MPSKTKYFKNNAKIITIGPTCFRRQPLHHHCQHWSLVPATRHSAS